MSPRSGPLPRLRRALSAHRSLLRGVAGLVGGATVGFLVLASLLGSNWRLAYRGEWLHRGVLWMLAPAAVGVASPLWYWLGRPVWTRLDRPGEPLVGRWRRARFLPGLLAALVGLWLFLQVDATSRFWTQVLAPLGLFVGLGGPAWWWLVRPLLGGRFEGWLERSPVDQLVGSGRWRPMRRWVVRLTPALLVLVVASVAVTSAVALPVVPAGEAVGQGGLVVTVSDARIADALVEHDGEGRDLHDSWRFVVVRLTVSNRAGEPRTLPGYSAGDVVVIAPECDAQTFGEPSNNCNQVYLDRTFTADGGSYPSYVARREAAGGTIAPGETITGWLAYRIENPPVRDPDFEPMVVVDDVGRWSLGEDWPTVGT